MDESGNVKTICQRTTYQCFGESTAKDEKTIALRSFTATVVSDICYMLIVTRDSYNKHKDVDWFKPLVQRISKQGGNAMVELLMEIPFLSHISRQKLALLGELFSYNRFPGNSLVCEQVDE